MINALLKKLLKGFLDSVVFPEITSLENKIGSDTVKEIIQNITMSAESWVDNSLSMFQGQPKESGENSHNDQDHA